MGVYRRPGSTLPASHEFEAKLVPYSVSGSDLYVCIQILGEIRQLGSLEDATGSYCAGTEEDDVSDLISLVRCEEGIGGVQWPVDVDKLKRFCSPQQVAGFALVGRQKTKSLRSMDSETISISGETQSSKASAKSFVLTKA